MPPTRLVLFDMDGVIADTEPIHFEATNAVLGRAGAALTGADIREFLGNTDEHMFTVLKERFGLPRPVAGYVAEKTAEVIERMGAGLVPAEGVCELLLRLRMGGVATVVASSSVPELIDAVIDGLGLRKSFDGLYSASMVGRGKPHPDLLLHAAERQAVPARECLVIEDAPSGIAAARAAGMRVCAVRTALTEERDLAGADWVVSSLARFDPEVIDGC